MKITDKTAPVSTAAKITPATWEHRSVRMEAGAPLDQIGADGWELVAVVPCLTDPAMVVAYFKRRCG